MHWVAVLLLFVALSSQSQTVTQAFGSGASSFSIDFVSIGNAGNAPDTTGKGAVPYIYNLGKYEVSRDMVIKASTAGGLGLTLQDMTSYGGNGVNRPATGISWNEAARFVNWLNTSKGYQAAYKFDTNGNFQLWNLGDTGFMSNNPFRNGLARFVLPNMNEWYKGAYGSLNNTWHLFPTGSTYPASVNGGTAPDTEIFGFLNSPADISSAGGLSSFGTMAQGGNAEEWIEDAYDGINDTPNENRGVLGGHFNSGNPGSKAVGISGYTTSSEFYFNGFRVAMIPEPSSLSLFLAGGAVLMAGRRGSKASASYG
ncbi:MAG: PEP-CTERM sorting domain-containing protein [Verrucomicrobia bacterium]|nr:PEP-CTERM sorting domain-containing protein [Verrucomicrobiota bacterium]